MSPYSFISSEPGLCSHLSAPTHIGFRDAPNLQRGPQKKKNKIAASWFPFDHIKNNILVVNGTCRHGIRDVDEILRSK